MTEDTISRQAAVEGSKELFALGGCYCDEYAIVGMLNSLPSAQSERKTGKWIKREFPMPLSDSSKIGYLCTECLTHWDVPTNYCPHCGAKMENEC